jgi:tripartite-type tricarboxylate transporter receptor subunit TctC
MMSNRVALGSLALAAALGMLGATEAALAQDFEPEFVDGVLQRLPDGFPSEDITLIVADSPTSAEGILMQNLVEVAAKYSPVGVRAEAREDFEAFGSWEALRYMLDTEGGNGGYINLVFGTPGGLVDLHAAPVTRDVGVGLDDLTEIITLESRPYAVIVCSQVDFEKNWESLIQQIKDNPGELRYMGGGPGAGTDMTFAYYMHTLRMGSLYDKSMLNHINVGNTAARALAVAACEGQVTTTTMDLALTHTQSDKVDVVLIGGDTRVAEFADVPTAADVGIPDDPMSSTKQIVLTSKVDPERVAWLNALWSAVANDADYQAARKQAQLGTVIKILNPQESAEFNDTADAKMNELTRTLGINTDDQ